MKYLIASDIHGSAAYCKKLVEAFERENADTLLLLGDVLYHGPRNALPTEYDAPSVMSMLNAMKDKIMCVRGNCDAEVDQMVLEFPIQADYMMLCDGGKLIFATHGHVYSPGRPPAIAGVDVLLTGHTHIPAFEDHGDYIYMNPGSVSIPKAGSRHSYMTMENLVFEWKDLDGNVYHTEDLSK